MSELSFFEKLTSNLKLSKAGRVGMTLSYFDVIELLGELEALKAYIAELVDRNDRLQDGWFDYETICPDGSLRPKVSDLLEDLDIKKTMISERDKALSDMVHELSRMEIAKDELQTRIEELKKAYMKIEDETDDLILEREVETGKLQAKIAELRDFIARLIEAGNALDVPPDDFSEEQKEWRELVSEWKECEK